MLTISIVDDGVGCLATYSKLKQAVLANYQCIMLQDAFPLGKLSRQRLFAIANKVCRELLSKGSDIVVFSSVALSNVCTRHFVQQGLPVFGCDAPIGHSCTYTASKVLVVGDKCVTDNVRLSNVIALPLPDFPILAEKGNERDIVQYLTTQIEDLQGFDCIAFANSSMNLYKHCFRRVVPNVQIFDTLQGISRRLYKKYHKFSAEESTIAVLDQQRQDISEKYCYFLQ